MLNPLGSWRLSAKVALLGAGSVLITAAALVTLAVWQSGQYNILAQKEVDGLIDADLDHITQGVYNLVYTENEAVQQQVDYNLNVARHVLANAGNVTLSEETTTWKATNQFTNKSTDIQLHKMLVNNRWLGQNTDPAIETPIVDEVTRLVGETATIFQRINESGDMLRVATTVKTIDRKRAIGTYIPAVNPDGTLNPVIAAVLKGKTYHGRAFVVNTWYLTAYEPVKDRAGRLVGMLYVGIKQKNVESRLRQAILQTKVGKTGYVYVLGGKGEDRGRYVISQRGERDGEDIWENKDSDGRYVIKETTKKAIALKPGEMATERYRWQNPGESQPRWKIARLAYFEPWDWVIGTSAYEDELQDYRTVLSGGRVRMTGIMALAGLIITLSVGLVGILIAWTIARPVRQMTTAVETIMQGNLNQVVDVRSRDEVGTLAQAFNLMTDKLKQTMDGLRKNEAFLNNIVENIPDMIFVKDAKDLRFVRFNRAGEELLGYTREELLGKNDYDMFPKQEADFFTTKDRDVLLNKHLVDIPEESIQTRNMGERILHTKKIPIFDDEGKPVYLLGISEDITDHKRAEDVLRWKTALLEAQVNTSIDGILVVDESQRRIITNRRLIDLWGVPKHILDDEDDAALLEYVVSLVRHPEQFIEKVTYLYDHPYEISRDEIEFKDGMVLDRYSAPVLGEDGHHYGRIWTFRDITDRKRMEEEIIMERSILKTLSDNAPFGMVLIDKEGRFTYMNAKFIELFGFDLLDIPDGKTWFRKAYPDTEYRHAVISLWIEDYGDAKPGAVKRRIFTAACKDGAQKIVQFISSALVSGDYLLACEDITELKHLESQLVQAQKMEAIGTLAGGIAHDFNNILTVITGFGTLLQMAMEETNPLRYYVDQILSSSQKAGNLTGSLLAFSRKQPIVLAPISLNSTIKGTEKLLKRLLTEDIELITSLSLEDITVMADPTQVDQMLFNLTTNARDALKGGGKLTIETKLLDMEDRFEVLHETGDPGRYALLTISDNGSGMDESTVDKVFDPFFTTKEVGKGTGLGLATVYGLVKQHNGYIDVSSKVGVGTTFSIYLPAIETPAKEEETFSPTIQRGNETILIAEDDADVRFFLTEILAHHGYTVLEAVDGQDAIDMFGKHTNIDLMILDSVMPRKNGREAYNAVKGLKPDTKALFMSGYTKDIILDKGVEEGKVDFITKPILPDELLKKVREVLDK